MKIQCDCGQFQAQLNAFPRNSPGRLACYCDDCQAYLERLGRSELLDEYGGTEIVPVYPSDISILSGAETLRCNVLYKGGTSRWSADCCNSPIANTRPGFPWAGILSSAYKVADPQALAGLGGIRSRIMGRFARGTPPFRISSRIGPADMLVVLPFLVKGKLLGKGRPSPFFREDGITPISPPRLLEEGTQ